MALFFTQDNNVAKTEIHFGCSCSCDLQKQKTGKQNNGARQDRFSLLRLQRWGDFAAMVECAMR